MQRWRRAVTVIIGCLAVALGASACSNVVDGSPGLQNAADAKLDVVGVDPDSSFDATVQNALSDIQAFWKINYPGVSGGKPLDPLGGGLYSVDGQQVVDSGEAPAAVEHESCISRHPDFIVDNGAFCLGDDSIAWDRAPTHLFAKLAQQYGPFMVALIFAHEYGHAISYRLGVFDQDLETIDIESQADCAAGAWAASALAHQDPHFLNVTPQTLDDALAGFLDGRDSTPGTIDQITHGNGFDRLSALADGLAHGVTYCYSKNYFDRTFTERPFTSQRDYDAGGNASLAETIDPSGFAVRDLNRYWAAQARTVGKTFRPVRIAEAAHPACGSSSESEFGYCPDDNTVYFSTEFATSAYNSLSGVDIDSSTGDVTLVFHQPADFALGELFSIGWGLAVRHQLFDGGPDDADALLAAVCYTGAYAKDVNVAGDPTGTRLLTLSPADLDEAVSALLDEAGKSTAFGARGTSGLDRIQSFVKGYKQPLSSC